jgi:hypothetical protein
MNTFSERTMMVGYTSSSNCASWCCDKELPCRCAGMSVKRGEQLVDRIHVPALHERGPDRHIGVLQAAADEAVHAIGRIVQRLGGSQQLIECVRELQPFVLEQLFIPVQDPIDKSNQMRTNGDEAVAAARVYQQLLSKYALPGVTGFNWNESQTTFSQGGAAMWSTASASPRRSKIQPSQRSRAKWATVYSRAGRKAASPPRSATASAWSAPPRSKAQPPVRTMGDHQEEPGAHACRRRGLACPRLVLLGPGGQGQHDRASGMSRHANRFRQDRPPRACPRSSP